MTLWLLPFVQGSRTERTLQLTSGHAITAVHPTRIGNAKDSHWWCCNSSRQIEVGKRPGVENDNVGLWEVERLDKRNAQGEETVGNGEE